MLWSFIKFSQLILKGNVWRSVWRICTWILGLKGLRWWVINWLYMIWDWVFTLNLINTLNLFLLKISIDHIFELIRSLFALESWLQYTILNVWYDPSIKYFTLSIVHSHTKKHSAINLRNDQVESQHVPCIYVTGQVWFQVNFELT